MDSRIIVKVRWSNIGIWRSLVARYTGGVEVVGSSPAIPIKNRVHLDDVKIRAWAEDRSIRGLPVYRSLV